MTDLWAPFLFPFMQNAFLIAALLSIPTALLSCFLVLKGWALMGDAISHAVLPGVVLSYILGLPLLIGAFAAGMVCALATGYLQQNSRVKQDTVMGVVFSGMFALGLVMYTKIQTDVHLDHILFGNILGIAKIDLLRTAGITAATTSLILIFRKDLMLHSFDPAQAEAIGLNTRLLHYGLLAILSLTIVAALKAVGIILAIAFLVTPGAVGFLLTRQFGSMLLVACATSLSACFVGIYLSFFISSAPAPTIVLVLSAIFLAAFLWKLRQASTAESLG